MQAQDTRNQDTDRMTFGGETVEGESTSDPEETFPQGQQASLCDVAQISRRRENFRGAAKVTRSEYSVPLPPRRVIASIDWLGVVSAAAEARAERLRAALGQR